MIKEETYIVPEYVWMSGTCRIIIHDPLKIRDIPEVGRIPEFPLFEEIDIDLPRKEFHREISILNEEGMTKIKLIRRQHAY